MSTLKPAIFELLPKSCESRWFTAENPEGKVGGAHLDNDGRKRRASLELAPGERVDLAYIPDGVGIIRRIWLTVFALRSPDSPQFLRGMRMEVTYDGANTPAINVPLGEFFCQGLGRISRFENEFFSSPEGKSLVSCLPMPFRQGVRVTLINDTPFKCRKVYYEVNATVGDPLSDDVGYLHAHWRRERPTRMMQDFEFLPKVEGRGRFVGACFSVLPDRDRFKTTWWGEGEVKLYVDGDKANPTLCGTGTEDYIGTGWGQREFAHRLQGSPIAEKTDTEFAYSFYRFHAPDPVVFHREFRGTVQQIGSWSKVEDYHATRDAGTMVLKKGGEPFEPHEAPGFSHFEREDDWSAISWFYLDKPENGLPSPPSYEERVAGLVPEILREWKVVGPFPGNVPGKVSLDDFPPYPIDPLVIASGKSESLPWKNVSAESDGLVDLARNLGPQDWCMAYGMAEFESPCEKLVTMACTSDDGIRIWLNGEQVYTVEEPRPSSFNLPERVPVKLVAGRNQVLVKVTNFTGGWGFGLGFKCAIRPI